MRKFSWRNSWYVLEKVYCYLLVFVVPFYFFCMMTLVRQSLVDIYKPGLLKYVWHVSLSTYCFINTFGNLIMGVSVDSSIQKSCSNGTDYCEKCNIMRPPKSWHCTRCDKCILKRDHHCVMFSQCIGLENRRYYILFLGHLAASLIYASYYSYYCVAAKFDKHGLILMAFRIVNPVLRYAINEPLSMRDMYVVFLFLNFSLILWAMGLFLFHLRNVLKGVTTHERHDGAVKVLNPKWRENLESVLGTRWKWAIIWPFVDSPLPSKND